MNFNYIIFLILFKLFFKNLYCLNETNHILFKDFIYLNISNGILKGIEVVLLSQPNKSAYIFKVKKFK